jgi:hypothetical protein
LVPIAGSEFASPLKPYQKSTSRNARMQPTKMISASTRFMFGVRSQFVNETIQPGPPCASLAEEDAA